MLECSVDGDLFLRPAKWLGLFGTNRVLRVGCGFSSFLAQGSLTGNGPLLVQHFSIGLA